ncbi:4-hydroxyphenylpyruvate dioxygenase [Nocardia huaxiensis]|uniref:4-hydroxyphenylpyruvate dioxygenase n=1 Tax=Nocardia huaxiensis TaxID=2755382 RepID=A0A7D6VD61_9NOCA|nr:4-hydroxyphenylpyruvate dioxygenase [Nocardia huaxiensis]QLY29575.1 4-hydroxyphenylpyruvate dioxygenase [Nocardia huaxiensis]UFS96858.1 4-hydroxyphenylpyruvate dioxygenase [Nocardia huaxiensis]
MDIQGIDHIEFCVGDAQQSAFYLCTAFGFRTEGLGGPETGLAGQRSLLLRHGDIRLVLTSALEPDHPAARYVAAHGDGVSCVALGTADARAAFDLAVARGAEPLAAPREYRLGRERVVTAEVGGFGDVRHRFVQRSDPAGEFLPGAMSTLATDPEPRPELLRVVDHVAVCLPAGTLPATVAYYEQVFGFRTVFEEHIEVGEQAMNSKVVQSDSTGVTFTLIEPDTAFRPGQIDRFLTAHRGAGVQHLAFLTADIIGAVTAFEDRGARFLHTPASYYAGLRARFGDPGLGLEQLRDTHVLVDRDHWGEVFQVFSRSVHARETFFLELIDRHGAKTFGSGNIKALYQAVQTAESQSDLVTASAEEL